MTREDMHDLILGAALVALGYAIYHHRQAATAQTIAASDQAAIQTAIDSGSTGYPAITIPAPIPINGNAATGYTVDTTSQGWWDNLTKGAF
jgi:hypothetical protein